MMVSLFRDYKPVEGSALIAILSLIIVYGELLKSLLIKVIFSGKL